MIYKKSLMMVVASTALVSVLQVSLPYQALATSKGDSAAAEMAAAGVGDDSNSGPSRVPVKKAKSTDKPATAASAVGGPLKDQSKEAEQGGNGGKKMSALERMKEAQRKAAVPSPAKPARKPAEEDVLVVEKQKTIDAQRGALQQVTELLAVNTAKARRLMEQRTELRERLEVEGKEAAAALAKAKADGEAALKVAAAEAETATKAALADAQSAGETAMTEAVAKAKADAEIALAAIRLKNEAAARDLTTTHQQREAALAKSLSDNQLAFDAASTETAKLKAALSAREDELRTTVAALKAMEERAAAVEAENEAIVTAMEEQAAEREAQLKRKAAEAEAAATADAQATAQRREAALKEKTEREEFEQRMKLALAQAALQSPPPKKPSGGSAGGNSGSNGNSNTD